MGDVLVSEGGEQRVLDQARRAADVSLEEPCQTLGIVVDEAGSDVGDGLEAERGQHLAGSPRPLLATFRDGAESIPHESLEGVRRDRDPVPPIALDQRLDIGQRFAVSQFAEVALGEDPSLEQGRRDGLDDRPDGRGSQEGERPAPESLARLGIDAELRRSHAVFAEQPRHNLVIAAGARGIEAARVDKRRGGPRQERHDLFVDQLGLE